METSQRQAGVLLQNFKYETLYPKEEEEETIKERVKVNSV